MKWLLSFLFFIYSIYGYSQVIENPVFDRASRHVFHIEKIELLKDFTLFYCSIDVPNDSWANISPSTFVEDDITKIKYKIIRSDGIPFSPSIRNFDNAMNCKVTLFFPSIAKTSRINLIESSEEEGFNVYGISLTDKYSSIYTSTEYERLSKMSNFWISSGNNEKAIEIKNKEIEASRYLFGDKSNLYISGIFQLSDIYLKHNNVSEALIWKRKAAERCREISTKLIATETQYGEKEYYMQDLELFCEKQISSFRYYFDNHEWNEAKGIMQNVYQLLKDNYTDTVYIPIILHFIGISSYYAKDAEDAEKYYLLSYNSFQKHEELKSYPVYNELLSGLSLLYNDNGDYEKAYNISQEAISVSRKFFGDNSKEYGYALAGLANAEIMLNKKEEGLLHVELASAIIEKANDVPENIKDIYRKRVSAIKNVLNASSSIYPSDSNDSITNNTSFLFEANNAILFGDLNSAIKKLYIIKDNLESDFESIDLHLYIHAIVSLSDCLSQIGELAKADIILDDALNILLKYKVKSNLVRHLYASKGQLYIMLGDYISSINWIKKAVEMFRLANDNSIAYARVLNNISSLNIHFDKYDEAKKCLDEAFEICKQFYDDADNTSDYLTILNNLATSYFKMGDNDRGEEIYKTIISKATSQNAQRIKALALCNLADVYLLKQDLQSAKHLYEKASLLDVDGYIKDMTEVNLLFCYILDNDSKIVKRLDTFNNMSKEKLSDVFGRFTEFEREKYWIQWSQILTFLNNLAVITYNTPQTRQMAYDNALYTKNMLINSEQLLEKISKENDMTNNIFSSMKQYKEKLSYKGLSKDSIYIYKENISQLEKKIINYIPNFVDKLKSQFKSYTDVKQLLSDDETAIEFVYLPQATLPIEDSKLLYGALILTKNDEYPKLVPLCKEEELEKILCIGDTVLHYNPDVLYDINDTTLYRMIWSKIEPYVTKGFNIYYSPTGLINRINLSAISDGTHRLEDLYDLYEVTTTSNIDKSAFETKKRNHNVTLFGDINYNEDSDIMEKHAHNYSSYSPGKLLSLRSLDRSSWDLLPSTKDEIEDIYQIVKHNGMSAYIYNKENANEESFKSLHGKSSEIIHIATHGFYFPEKNATTTNAFNSMHSYTSNDRRLLYSGLLFAGANNTWKGKEIKDGVEDGILTADEISRLDLSNTNLVVLSACDTGLGDVDKINGVFGLQRGFKRAGVKSILMTLWKVDDEATKILMVEFYRNLMLGKSKHQSLKEAQNYLRHIGDGKYNAPKYWASFILLDGLN